MPKSGAWISLPTGAPKAETRPHPDCGSLRQGLEFPESTELSAPLSKVPPGALTPGLLKALSGLKF